MQIFLIQKVIRQVCWQINLLLELILESVRLMNILNKFRECLMNILNKLKECSYHPANTLDPLAVSRSQGFADFSQFSTASSTSAAPAGQVTSPSTGSNDLFDMFASPAPAPPASATMNMNMTATSQVSMSAGMTMPMVRAWYSWRWIVTTSSVGKDRSRTQESHDYGEPPTFFVWECKWLIDWLIFDWEDDGSRPWPNLPTGPC